MASVAQTISQEEREENASEWFWNFLKRELAPYPGRAWTVARMTLAATIVMLLIMTFRLPNAALGAYYTLLISRENPRATLHNAISMLGSVSVALLFVLSTAAALAGSPMLHFGWIALTLFVTFFLIDALAEYRMGTAFGFLAVSSITAWDFPANTETLVENTLWTALAVSIGVVTTVVVEYVSSILHPQDQIGAGICARLEVVEQSIRCLALQGAVAPEVRDKLEQYAMTGTALIRRAILRSSMDPAQKQEISAVVALTGRLIDLTGNARVVPENDAERERYLQAADNVRVLRNALQAGNLAVIEELSFAPAAHVDGSFLSDVEMTMAEIPQILAGIKRRPEYFPSAVDEETREGLFKVGAFTNGEAVRFALRGTLAALSCYIVYNAIAWRGLTTAVSTCMITALSNVGSSRQKQFLRVSGTILGGVVIGMTAQVALLPYLDNIASFTILFVAVTALSGWIGTASPRLSYAGVQTGFAFYVTHLRVFAPQTSLAVARDDVMGILLGLLAMWLLFDTIWARDAATEMVDLFLQNLRRIAVFHTIIPSHSLAAGINRSRAERAAITRNFDQIRNLSDSVVFEFGPDRPRKLELRRILRALQPQLRAYFLLEISMLHYRFETTTESAALERDRNIAEAEELLRLLADHAAEASLSLSTGDESEALRAHHKDLFALIQNREGQLNTAESQAGAASHDLRLSRWMLAAALVFGRTMMTLEQASLLEESGPLSISHPSGTA